jgi:hypothetical protein
MTIFFAAQEVHMKKLIRVALVVTALSLGAGHALAGAKATASLSCGTTYSVAAEEGSLLLQHHGKFSLINVAPAAAIHDGKGHALTLGDIRAGDWIQYWTALSAGKTVIRKISVNTGARAGCSSPTVLGLR